MGLGIRTRLKRCVSALVPIAIANRTYMRQFDLSESVFKWWRGPRCPQRRVEGNGVVLNGKLYLFGGYVTIGEVSNLCHIFDLATKSY